MYTPYALSVSPFHGAAHASPPPRAPPPPPAALYRLDSLPSIDLVWTCIHSFFASTRLLYVCSRERASALVSEVYGPSTQSAAPDGDGLPASQPPRTTASLCELLALASVGALHEPEHVSAATHGALFGSARHYLDTVLGAADAQTVRTLSSLAMCAILEKRIAACSYVTMALRLAEELDTAPDGPDSPEFARNWRSLVFLDAWLSATLGRLPREETPAPDFGLLGEEADGDEDSAQAVLDKLGVLMMGVTRHVYAPRHLSLVTVRAHLSAVSAWSDALPSCLTPRWDSPEWTAHTSDTSLYVRLLYLSTLILLTRRVLLDHARGRAWADSPDSADRVLEDPHGTAEEYSKLCTAGAATETAYVLAALLQDGAVPQRSWLAIHSAYTAGLLLLFAAAAPRAPAAAAAKSLSDAEGCVRVLEHCAGGGVDEAAEYYARVLRLFVRRLKWERLRIPTARVRHLSLQEGDGGGGGGGGGSRVADADCGPTPLVAELLDEIRRPFGGEADVQVVRNLQCYLGESRARFLPVVGDGRRIADQHWLRAESMSDGGGAGAGVDGLADRRLRNLDGTATAGVKRTASSFWSASGSGDSMNGGGGPRKKKLSPEELEKLLSRGV